MNSVADVWDNILQQLKKELSETTIATWFDELAHILTPSRPGFFPV